LSTPPWAAAQVSVVADGNVIVSTIWPVVDQLVTSDAHQPGHRHRVWVPGSDCAHARHVHLLSDVLCHAAVARRATVEVGIDIAKGAVVERGDGGVAGAPCRFRVSCHTYNIA